MNTRNVENAKSAVGKGTSTAASSKSHWQRTSVSNLLLNSQSGIYYARVQANGKEIWRSLKTDKPSVAKLLLGDLVRDIHATSKATNAEGQSTGPESVWVERFMSIYLSRTAADSSLAPRSKTRRETAVKALRKTWPELAQRDVRKISPTDCQNWARTALREGTGFIAPNVKTKRKGMSPSAFNKTVDTLRTIFAIAAELGMIYKNPAADIKKARISQRRLELPTVSQFQEVLTAVASSGTRPGDAVHQSHEDCHDMARLLAYSGMRLGEGCAVQWKHVNFGTDRLTVPGSKTESSYRVIPLFPPLRALLNEIRDRRGKEANEAPILRIKECQKTLKTACAKVGVKRLTHHDLRHLFATVCIESGVDIPTVSKWLGHSDGGALAMKTYGHLRQEHSAAQAVRVNFGGPPS